MLKQKGIDLDKLKEFGPRAQTETVIEGAEKVIDGRDPFFTDMDILRMVNGRSYDMARIIRDLYYHL